MPVCFLEDDCYIIFEKDRKITSVFRDNNSDDEEYDGEDILDIPSGANDGLTLRQGRENYKKYGSCDKKCSNIAESRKNQRSDNIIKA